MNIEEWSGYEVSEHVLEEAATWIALLDSETLTEAQQVVFYQWLQADPSHQHAYLDISELWAKSSCIKSMEHIVKKSKVIAFPSQLSKDRSQPEIISSSTSPSWAYSLAISLILIGLGLPVIQHFVLVG